MIQDETTHQLTGLDESSRKDLKMMANLACFAILPIIMAILFLTYYKNSVFAGMQGIALLSVLGLIIAVLKNYGNHAVQKLIKKDKQRKVLWLLAITTNLISLAVYMFYVACVM